jgi:hypothetical protein
VTAEDWETKYREAWERFKQERLETLRLKDRMSHKQERYIAREQEYRKTIEEIEKDIEVHSTRPLRIVKELDENALLLMGIDPSAPEHKDQVEREKRHKANNEHINPAKV